MYTIEDELPQNAEERYEIISGPVYKRLNVYLQDEYSVDILFCKDESIENMLIYATCLFYYVTTKHCTNPNNVDVLYLADELAMKAATDYIDEKVKEPLEVEKLKEDPELDEFIRKYPDATEEERELLLLEISGYKDLVVKI